MKIIRKFHYLLLGLGLHLGVSACQPQKEAQSQLQPAPQEENTPPQKERWPVQHWGELRDARQALALLLADPERWVARPATGTWSKWEHAPSRSQLWLRHQVARRTVTVEECEEEARRSLSVLRWPGSEVQEEPLRAPQAYHGLVRTELVEGGRGRVLAVGAGVSRCYAAVFLSEADEELPQRLSLAAYILGEQVRLLGVEERSPRRGASELP